MTVVLMVPLKVASQMRVDHSGVANQQGLAESAILWQGLEACLKLERLIVNTDADNPVLCRDIPN